MLQGDERHRQVSCPDEAMSGRARLQGARPGSRESVPRWPRPVLPSRRAGLVSAWLVPGIRARSGWPRTCAGAGLLVLTDARDRTPAAGLTRLVSDLEVESTVGAPSPLDQHPRRRPGRAPGAAPLPACALCCARPRALQEHPGARPGRRGEYPRRRQRASRASPSSCPGPLPGGGRRQPRREAPSRCGAGAAITRLVNVMRARRWVGGGVPGRHPRERSAARWR